MRIVSLAFGLALVHAQSSSRAAPLPRGTVADMLGVNVHFSAPEPDEIAAIAAAGFRWVRTDFIWSETERVRGQYDFSKYDGLVRALNARGLRAMLILDYANPLYEGGQAPASAESQRAFADWAAAAIRHFRGNDIVWELYNEPNLDHFWRPSSNPAAYAELAKRVARELDADDAIIGPAVARVDLKFVESCARAGVIEHWSAISVHPYRELPPESVVDDYRRLRSLLAKYEAPNRRTPIIVSEWGYADTWKGMNRDEQAALLVRQWLVNASEDVRISIWYDWRDDGTELTNHEHHFGVVGAKTAVAPAATAKPALRAATTFASTLGRYTFARRLDLPSRSDWALEFQRGDSKVVVVWTTGRAHSATVAIPEGRLSIRQLDGATVPVPTTRSPLRIELTSHPQYLIVERVP